MKFLLLFCFVLLSFTIQSQDTIGSQLLDRLEAIGSTGKDVTNYFSKDELEILKKHIDKENSNSLTGENFEGVNFYGYETTADMYGFVEIDNTEELIFLSEGGMSSATESGGAVNPDNPNQAYVVDSDGNFFDVEISTGQYTFMGILDLEGITALEFNPLDNTLYALTGNISGAELFTIDPSNLTTSFVGLLNSVPAGIPVGLAIDSEGAAFMYDVLDDNIYSVNLNTGNAVVVGSIGFDANFGQGMAWDPNTDEIYLMAFNNDVFDAEIRLLDRTNFTTSLVGGVLPGETTQLSWGTIPSLMPTAVETVFSNATDVYPNPSTGLITISNIDKHAIHQVDIIDLHGHVVKSLELNNASLNQIQIDLPVVQGVYFVKIYFEEASVVKKVFKH